MTRFYGSLKQRKLLGETIPLEKIINDNMIRSSDKVFEVDAKRILLENWMATITEYNVEVQRMYGDTTFETLYGVYEDSVEKENTTYNTKRIY